GAGKSTLLRTISGLGRPWRGRVRFGGREITALAPEQIVRLGIAHVPQGRRLFADLSVRENLLLGAYARDDAAGIAGDFAYVLDTGRIVVQDAAPALLNNPRVRNAYLGLGAGGPRT